MPESWTVVKRGTRPYHCIDWVPYAEPKVSDTLLNSLQSFVLPSVYEMYVDEADEEFSINQPRVSMNKSLVTYLHDDTNKVHVW